MFTLSYIQTTNLIAKLSIIWMIPVRAFPI